MASAPLSIMDTMELASARPSGRQLAVAGLFAGIGGIELGLHQAWFRTEMLFEIDDAAVAVLDRGAPRDGPRRSTTPTGRARSGSTASV
jgi:hypothetical protein